MNCWPKGSDASKSDRQEGASARGAVHIPDGVEITEACFWPPESFASLDPDRLERRLHLAVTAVRAGVVVYAENGVPLPGTLPLLDVDPLVAE